MSPLKGFYLLLAIVFGIAGYVAICYGLSIDAQYAYAGYLFLWFWGNIDQVDFQKITATVLGAFFGVGLAWLFQVAPALYGAWGAIGALLIVIASIYVVIMNWVPLVFNMQSMLLLTVCAMPLVVANQKFEMVAAAIAVSAVYFGVLVWVGMKIYNGRSSAVVSSPAI